MPSKNKIPYEGFYHKILLSLTTAVFQINCVLNLLLFSFILAGFRQYYDRSVVKDNVPGIAAILIAGVNPFQIRAEKKAALTGTAALEARIKKLEDREEIKQLLLDYGCFLDKRDFKSFSELFAKNEGEWIGGMGRAKGSQAIRELMESTIGKDTPMNKSVHLFTNEMIQVDGNKATALTKWIFVVTAESNRPQLFFVGHYEDTMIKEIGRWKFLRRKVHADIPTDDQIKR